jgi:dipeptidyl aminopeptidase/acylaminoacyl peptidase
MVTGKEVLRINAPEGVSTGIFLRSSGRIGFRKVNANTGGYIFDPATGESTKVTEGGYLMDLDRKEETGLLRPPTKDRAAIGIIDLKSGRQAPLLRAEHWNIYQAHFSPDDRWIAFLANTGPDAGRIFVARPKGIQEIPQADWLPITDGKTKVDKPRFSPDGKLIYFTLDGSGTRSVQAVRFDPENGRPAGEPFLVYDFRGPRLSMVPVSLGVLEISIARDKMVMMVAESNFNIWMAELGMRP